MKEIIEKIKFDSAGLVPVIAQDYLNGDVLMLAWANREAVELTLEKGVVHYWSRSRNKLWLKGETSGNVQQVKELYYDCDADAILAKVDQTGAACHTGNRSCFYTRIDGGEAVETGEKLFDPEKVYGKGPLEKIFDRLAEDIKISSDEETNDEVVEFREELRTDLRNITGEFLEASEERQESRLSELAAAVAANTIEVLVSHRINYSDLTDQLEKTAQTLSKE